VYLSTSRWEGLPLSLLEASSLGLVIVASNVVGNNEVVVDGENGFLYDPNDIDQAANRLTQLIDDKTLYEKMSENAQAIFEKKFHSSTMISKLADVYSSYDSN
jgi:glycosyltransferase involved in cell wall biosynthesis